MTIDVGIIMGSRSDWETMRRASETLDQLGVSNEVRVVSAHRTPDLLFEYAESAIERGLKVIIAGAGGAAHLPGPDRRKVHQKRAPPGQGPWLGQCRPASACRR